MTKSPAEYTDEELLKGVLNDERHLQEMLYRKYADGMFAVACYYTNDKDEAADVLQEAFIKVFRKIQLFDSSGSLGGWIRKIVVNTALEHYRKKKRYEEIKGAYDEDDSSEEEATSSMSAAELVTFVNQLPAKAQMVLKLHVLEGYAHNEIAEALNITVGTSKSQLNRARQLLKGMIGTSYE